MHYITKKSFSFQSDLFFSVEFYNLRGVHTARAGTEPKMKSARQIQHCRWILQGLDKLME